MAKAVKPITHFVSDLVTMDDGTYYGVKCSSVQEAQHAAEAALKNNPGKTYYVMQIVDKVTAKVVINHEDPDTDA